MEFTFSLTDSQLPTVRNTKIQLKEDKEERSFLISDTSPKACPALKPSTRQ
jgi:hypothetical protein